MPPLAFGLYERLITRALRAKLDALEREGAADMVLETAVKGRADLLVTFNRRHFEAASATFGIDVESPAEAVRRLRGLL